MKTIKILLIASLFGLLAFFLFQRNVKAGSEHNVTGFAWSDKTSWISFNCLNDWDNDGVEENQCGRQNSSGLVLDLRLDEGLGLITHDNTVNDNDGHFGMDSDGSINASYYPKWKRGNDCKFRSCLEFDGSDVVRIHDIGDNATLDITGNLTIEVWVKFSDINAKQSIIGKKEDWAGYGLRLNEEATPDQKLYFVLEGSAPDVRYKVASTTQVVANEWYHVVGVRDGTYMKIYVNGVLENTLPNTTLAANNYDLFLGADPAGTAPGSLAEIDYPLKGSIDEVKIYSRALSEPEINTSGYYNYGVSIDTETGIFDGYAWSENLGYVTFRASDLVGCPVSPCRVETDFTKKPREIFGWARACAVFQSGCSGSLSPNRGGWDGWIRLRGNNYSVMADTSVIPTQLKGWAWADDRSIPILGWISFNKSNCENNPNCTCPSIGGAGCPSSTYPCNNACASSKNYKVTTSYRFNKSPYVEPGSGGISTTSCGIFSGQSRVDLSWVFRDGMQGMFQNVVNDTTADYTLQDNVSGESTERFGYSVASAGDVNGDGYDDVIVGAPFNSAGGTERGRAYIFYGKALGTMDASADITLQDHVSPENFEQFGFSVASAGDVNGDGYDDVIVGAHWHDTGVASSDRGRAYIFYGGATMNPSVDVTLQDRVNPVNSENFGYSVASAGDVNNDGFSDVIVGAYYHNAGGGAGDGRGRAYIFYGSLTAMDSSADITLQDHISPEKDELFGWSVSSAGDVNNDGYDDVIVGAFKNNAGGGSSVDRGRAYIFYGGATMNPSVDVTLQDHISPQNVEYFGDSVASAGDVNNDGFSDVIVGAYRNNAGGTQRGRAYIFYGGATMNPSVDVTLQDRISPEDGEWFGDSVASAGDVNKDGFSDVIVGAAYHNAGGGAGAWRGRTYIFYGGTTMDPSVDATFQDNITPENDENFGDSVASAGDVNKDGFSDVIVGAYWHNGGGVKRGRAYVYLLSSSSGGGGSGDFETSFDFKVNDTNDVNDPSPEVSRSFGGLNNPDGSTNNQTVLVGSDLLFNKVYYWWAKVYSDMGGPAKNWFAGSTFTTPAHASPWPSFTHSPKSPSNKEVVNFIDESECYDTGSSNPYLCSTNPLNRYVWDFGDGTICDSNIDATCRGNVQHKYTVVASYPVTLTITDDLGTSCSGSGDSPVVVTYPLPEWKEIPPTSSLFKFFSGIGDFLKTGLF